MWRYGSVYPRAVWLGLFTAAACGGLADSTAGGLPGECPDGGCHSTQTEGGMSTTCEQRTSSIAAEVNAAVAQADRSCATDADCTNVALANGCYDACYGIASKTGAAAIQGVLAQIDHDICPVLMAGGCQVQTPPCFAPMPPSCVSGQCLGPQVAAPDAAPACPEPNSAMHACVLGFPESQTTLTGTVTAVDDAAADPSCFATTNAAEVLPAPAAIPGYVTWLQVQPPIDAGRPLVVGFAAPGAVPGVFHVGETVTVSYEKLGFSLEPVGALGVYRNGELIAFLGASSSGPFTVRAGAPVCRDVCGSYANMTIGGAPGTSTSIELTAGTVMTTYADPAPSPDASLTGSVSTLAADYYWAADPGECGTDRYLFSYLRRY